MNAKHLLLIAAVAVMTSCSNDKLTHSGYAKIEEPIKVDYFLLYMQKHDSVQDIIKKHQDVTMDIVLERQPVFLDKSYAGTLTKKDWDDMAKMDKEFKYAQKMAGKEMEVANKYLDTLKSLK